MPRGRTMTAIFTANMTENQPIFRAEEVDATRPEPMNRYTIGTDFAFPEPQVGMEEEISREMGEYPTMSSEFKVSRLDLRTVIELTLEQWSWIVEIGDADELAWPRWRSLRIDFPSSLCAYAERKSRRHGSFNRCNYCPYKVYFKERCDSTGRPYCNWRHSPEERFAHEFIKELVELREQIILNPEKFR